MGTDLNRDINRSRFLALRKLEVPSSFLHLSSCLCRSYVAQSQLFRLCYMLIDMRKVPSIIQIFRSVMINNDWSFSGFSARGNRLGQRQLRRRRPRPRGGDHHCSYIARHRPECVHDASDRTAPVLGRAVPVLLTGRAGSLVVTFDPGKARVSRQVPAEEEDEFRRGGHANDKDSRVHLGKRPHAEPGIVVWW